MLKPWSLQAFGVSAVGSAVAGDALQGLIGTLLGRMLDGHVAAFPDGDRLLKALNVLMMRILDQANRSQPTYLCLCPPDTKNLLSPV